MNSEALAQLLQLSPQLRKELLAELNRRITRHDSRRRIYALFPNEGPLRRELYPKHLEFFALGAEHEERAFIAGNRTGKTTAAAYEVACHLMGWYPPWWVGRRFTRPITAWACGEDAKAMRESIQPALCGPPEAFGTGTIPGDLIVGKSARSGVPDSIDSLQVRYATGIIASRLVFKTYDQGRESYQGASVDVVWYDEEPPAPIYTEGLTRTLSTIPGDPSGIVLCTFTPLKGLSTVVQSYLPGGKPDAETADV